MMKLIPYRQIASAVLVLAFPIAVLADLSQTTAVVFGTTLNLDTGAEGLPGPDLVLRGDSGLVPQGKATAYSLGVQGQSGFDGASSQTMMSLPAGAYTTNPISRAALVVNEV